VRAFDCDDDVGTVDGEVVVGTDDVGADVGEDEGLEVGLANGAGSADGQYDGSKTD